MKTINILALSLFILLAPGQIFSQQNGETEIAPGSVAAALMEGAIFVDVREANEVAVLAYDVPGVINIPLSELPDRLAELPLDQPIVLACRSGKRSVQAANLLTLNNFSEVSSLVGGIIAWEAAGLPVQEKDRSTEANPSAKMQGCSANKAGKAEGKSCCTEKGAEATAAASCGGKGKGKSCCAKGSR